MSEDQVSKNSPFPYLESLIKIVTGIGVVLLVTSFLEIQSYYSKFGIRITEFITPSEILLGSFNRIRELLYSTIIQLIFWLFVFKKIFDFDFNKKMAGRRISTSFFVNEIVIRFFKNKHLRYLCIAFFALLFLIAIFSKISPSNYFLKNALTFVSINLGILLFLYVGLIGVTTRWWRNLKENRIYDGKAIIAIAYLAFFLTLLPLIRNHFNYFEIKRNGLRNPLEIVLKNGSTISQNDSIKFIGKTENFYFYWNKNANKTTVYPADEVTLIVNE